MHFLQHLLRYMLPLQIMAIGETDNIPSGFDRVITKRGSFVITSRGNLIAKKY